MRGIGVSYPQGGSADWLGDGLAATLLRDEFFGPPAAEPGGVVAGAGAATEAGADTASSAGVVLVQGIGDATEVGSDTAAGTGGAPAVITGAGAAVELGGDIASGSGLVRVQGIGAANEAGADAASGTGGVLVQGAGAALESGSDVAAGAGLLLVRGSGAALESGADVALGSGLVVNAAIFGTGAAVETGTDTAAGSGVANAVFTLTGAQALLLRRLHQLHGLAQPLTVSESARSAGDLQQTVTVAGGVVTIQTVGGHDTLTGSVGQMIEELAALHGLGADLVVTADSRTAGAVIQSMSAVGGVTTVVRQ